MAWYLVKHRDIFTYIRDQQLNWNDGHQYHHQ